MIDRSETDRSRTDRSGAKPEDGFTLIEILVALAITGLAFGAALPLISTSLGRTTSTFRETEATTLAETILARIGHAIPLTDGNASGQDGELSWSLVIAPWSDEGSPDAHVGIVAHRVAVTVTWPGVSRPQSEQWVTLRLARSP